MNKRLTQYLSLAAFAAITLTLTSVARAAETANCVAAEVSSQCWTATKTL
jgi:hypothetical protein